MSKDDGVYVLVTRGESGPEYRFRCCHAGGNIFHDLSNMVETFENSQVYHSINSVALAASSVDNVVNTEHGVLWVNNYKDKTWKEIEQMYQHKLISSI